MILFVTTNICRNVVLQIVKELFTTEHTCDVVVFSGNPTEIIDTHFMQYRDNYPAYTDIVFLMKGEEPAKSNNGGNLMKQSVTVLFQQGGNIWRLKGDSGEDEQRIPDPQKIPLVLKRVLQQYKEQIG